MEGGSSGSGGGDGGSWFQRPRQSVKRNFSSMSASHPDDSPDSLFLPHNRDSHYDNEHSSRRRRLGAGAERNRRYHGDGLDFRRPVMSAGTPARSVGDGSVDMDLDEDNISVAAATAASIAPVIDLTEENEDESEGLSGGRGEREVTGVRRVNEHAGPSRAAGGQRLPRFGRDVIDVEERNPLHHHDYNDLRPRALESEGDDDAFTELPGANFLALPPRRSESGRVQYSTLRRPTRPPSPPQEMDDEDIEITGSRSFGNDYDWHSRARGIAGLPVVPHHARPRSVTPYPDEPHMPVAIDLTDDADDDVQIVDERRIHGVNLDRPELGAGNRTQAADDPGGFGIGRLAGLLREGGRLAQRVQNYAANHNNRNPAFEHMNDNQVQGRRAELEQQLAAHRERREQRLRRENLARPPTYERHGNGYRQNYVPTVHMRPDGTIPGYQRIGFPPGHPRAPRPAPFLGDIGGMMDYDMAAFDMGIGGNDHRPPTPKYSPPPEPAKGFTRNPGEDEMVVCPNCGNELAVGAEEIKQEIWVIKSCGHAYCGDCTQHRTKTKSKKGKDRAVDAEKLLPQPFKNCVVEGCNKSASARSMVRVYFGS